MNSVTQANTSAATNSRTETQASTEDEAESNPSVVNAPSEEDGLNGASQNAEASDSQNQELEEERREAAARAAREASRLAAAKESSIAIGRADEMKETMRELRVQNESAAIAYRAPNANLSSVPGGLFQTAAGGISGAGSGVGKLNDGFSLGGEQAKATAGRGLASDLSLNAAAAAGIGKSRGADTKANSQTSDDPWANYMSNTSKDALVNQLRNSSSLRDAIRKRLDELAEQTSAKNAGTNGGTSAQDASMILLMQEALREAEADAKKNGSLAELTPVSLSELFSMNDADTRAQIDSLLAELGSNASEAQFQSSETLFQRVNYAHRRSLQRGSVKSIH